MKLTDTASLDYDMYPGKEKINEEIVDHFRSFIHCHNFQFSVITGIHLRGFHKMQNLPQIG